MESFNAPIEAPSLGESTAPTRSFAERWQAASDLGNMETAAEMFGFKYINEMLGNKDPMQYMKDNDKIGELPPEELNKRFPDMEIPFDKPTSYLIANELNERAKEKKRLQNIVSGDGQVEQGFWSVSTAAALVQHATDPFEAGADALIGLSTGGLGILLRKTAAPTSKAMAIGLKLKDNTFTKAAIEGVTANTLIETQIYQEKEELREEYKIQDALISVAAGGLAFPAVAFGGARIADKIASTDKLFGMSFKGAYAQAIQGKKINLDAISDFVNNLRHGKSKIETTSFRKNFVHKDRSNLDFKKDTVFISRKKPSNDLELSENLHFGDDYGSNGIYATTNPDLAHNFAAELDDNIGDVLEVNLTKENFLNMDDPIDVKTLEVLNSKIEDPELREILNNSESINDIFDDIKDTLGAKGSDYREALDSIHTTLKESGYDGVYTSRNGNSNDVFIYDPESIQAKQRHEVNKNETPKVQEDSVKKSKEDLINNKERDIFHDAAIEREFNEIGEINDESMKDAMMKEYNELESSINEVVESGNANPELKALHDEIKTHKMLDQGEETILQKLRLCYMGKMK